MNQNLFHKLVGAIAKHGLDNVTILAEDSGIPIETARYMIWHELPRHCVSIGVDVNLERIGLEQWMVKMTMSRKPDREVISSFFRNEIGLTTLLSPMVTNSIAMLVAIPKGQHTKLERILEYLTTSGVLKGFTIKQVDWMRHVSLDPSNYDFQKRRWSFDWKNIELESMIRNKNDEQSRDSKSKIENPPRIDQKDLLILKALQRKVPRSISKLENVIGSDQHSLRYHYNRHVKPLIKGYYLKFQPCESMGSQNLFLFTYEPEGDLDLLEARRIASSLPFTTAEWKTNSEYFWLARWPGDHTNSVFKYLDKRTVRLEGNLDHHLIDSETETTQMIPSELFDEETKSWKYEPKKSMLVTQHGK